MNTIKLDTIALARIRIEDLTTEVITLAENLDAERLARSRLTRSALTRRLRQIAGIADDLPDAARAAMPEVDWTQWRSLGTAIRDGELDPAQLWQAASALSIETLQWMRVYREESVAKPQPHSLATPITATHTSSVSHAVSHETCPTQEDALQ